LHKERRDAVLRQIGRDGAGKGLVAAGDVEHDDGGERPGAVRPIVFGVHGIVLGVGRRDGRGEAKARDLHAALGQVALQLHLVVERTRRQTVDLGHFRLVVHGREADGALLERFASRDGGCEQQRTSEDHERPHARGFLERREEGVTGSVDEQSAFTGIIRGVVRPSK
jgi:hypothetical protein